MKAVKAKELLVKTDNKVGALADLSGIIGASGVNIRAVSAWSVGNEAFFRLITSDNLKTKNALKENGYSYQENDVVIVELPDNVGELSSLTTKLKSEGIDLTHIYGTTSKPGNEAIIVFSSNDNDKVISTIAS